MTNCCLVGIRAQALLEEAWECQNGSRLPRKNFWHIFASFLDSRALFCLKPTRNALFTPFQAQSCQVAVTKQIPIEFSRPGPFWASEWPRTSRKTLPYYFTPGFLISGVLFCPKQTRNAPFKPFSVELGYHTGNMVISTLSAIAQDLDPLLHKA